MELLNDLDRTLGYAYYNDDCDGSTLYESIFDESNQKVVIPGVHKIKIPFRSGKVYPKGKITVHETKNLIGTTFLNAVTGYPYTSQGNIKMKIGSEYEDAVFKVKVANGSCGSPGGVFIYDSPKQYESHFKCIVDKKVESEWTVKNQQCLALMAREREKMKVKQNVFTRL